MNKRHVERTRLKPHPEVRCAETGRLVGLIVDLTTAGMRLVTREELELEAIYHLIVSVDNDPEAPEDLRIDARCMWVGHEVNPLVHCAGFEFVQVEPEQGGLLSRLIGAHHQEPQHS